MYYQTVFDFFNDWDVIDIELINERLLKVQNFSPWGLIERELWKHT